MERAPVGSLRREDVAAAAGGNDLVIGSARRAATTASLASRRAIGELGVAAAAAVGAAVCIAE